MILQNMIRGLTPLRCCDEALDSVAAAAATVADSATRLAAPVVEGKTAWKYTKKAMALQNEYDIAAFNRTNERQDWLALNHMSQVKDALRQAGYSTADPNGTGYSLPQVSPQNTSSASFPHFSMHPTDFVGAIGALAQAKLAESQSNYIDRQASRYDEYTDAQIAEIMQRANEEESRSQLNFEQAQSIREMLPVLKEKGNVEVEKIKNEAAVLKKEEEKLVKEIDKINQDIKVGKSQEALNYASAEEARTRSSLNRQLESESDAREGLTRQEQETEKERTNLTHEQAQQARFDAIWKELEITARQNGFDINDSQAKQQYTHMCWKLVNAKDENDVKRILKHGLGNLGYAADWLLQQAGGLITGVAVGAMASKARGKSASAPGTQTPVNTKGPSVDPNIWYN